MARLLPLLAKLGTATCTHSNLLPKVVFCSTRINSRCLSTTCVRYDLNEFFDNKEHWSETKVQVGRPWKVDELRIKSNADLHKLWHVLLKERNMLMTMEEEYNYQAELFPSPERLEKVEESMENLLDVVAERDEAYAKLELDQPSHYEPYLEKNILGIEFTRHPQEYYFPRHMNPAVRKRWKLGGKWQEPYLRLWREKKLRQQIAKENKEKQYNTSLKKTFPDADID